jgi:hypothetical protein
MALFECLSIEKKREKGRKQTKPHRPGPVTSLSLFFLPLRALFPSPSRMGHGRPIPFPQPKPRGRSLLFSRCHPGPRVGAPSFLSRQPERPQLSPSLLSLAMWPHMSAPSPPFFPPPMFLPRRPAARPLPVAPLRRAQGSLPRARKARWPAPEPPLPSRSRPRLD